MNKAEDPCEKCKEDLEHWKRERASCLSYAPCTIDQHKMNRIKERLPFRLKCVFSKGFAKEMSKTFNRVATVEAWKIVNRKNVERGVV